MTYFQNFNFDFKNLYTQVSEDASHVYQQSQSKISELMNFIGKKYEDVKPKLAEYCKLPKKWHKIPKKCYKIPKKCVEKKLEKYWKDAEEYNDLYDALRLVSISDRIERLGKKIEALELIQNLETELRVAPLVTAKKAIDKYTGEHDFDREVKNKVDQRYLDEYSEIALNNAKWSVSAVDSLLREMIALTYVNENYRFNKHRASSIIAHNSPDQKNPWKSMPWDYKVFYVYPYKISTACTFENMEKWFEGLCENVWDNKYKLLAGAAVVGACAYVWKNPKILEQKSFDSLYKELSKMLKAGSDLLAGYSKQLGK